MNLIEHIIAIIAPYHCLGCGSEGRRLCLDCIYALPKIAGRCYRCGTTSVSGVCRDCSVQTGLQGVLCATKYEGLAKTTLWELKFNRSKGAARDIAQAMHCRTPELPAGTLVSFIPTAQSRVRQRGYDQAALIAKELARLRGLPCSPLLIRLGGHRQVGATAEERRALMGGAFRARELKILHKTTVLLVDDVITTGSSIEEASKVLWQAGATSIWALAFARAE